VGSYNLDPRSEKLNSETAVLVDSASVANLLAVQFVDDDLTKSRRVKPEEAALYKRPKGIDDKFELLFSIPMREWL
jgi:phosphatidylserine/phosphatidylglycerophosphate/cardiolipin synthase-like enzyme